MTANDVNVVVTFSEGGALTIEGQAELAPTGQPVVSFNDDDTASATDALRSLPGSRVMSGVAFTTGTLRLVLDTGVKLGVPFDPDYEAWQLTGPSGRMWVSLPGGGLALFPPTHT